MRLARLLLAGLLSLGVAIQGYAGSRAMETDCPMRQAAEALQAGPTAEAHEMHDMHDVHGAHEMPAMPGMHDAHGMADMPADAPCHDDAPAPAKGTGHCGCVVGCQPAGSLPMIAALLPSAESIVRASPPPVAVRFYSHTSLRHWRPPALT